MSDPICRITTLFAALLLALLIAGTIHTSKTRRLFDDVSEIRAELEEIELTLVNLEKSLNH